MNNAIQRVRRRKLAFFLIVLCGLILLLFLVKNLLISFLLAFVGFYLLSPVVDLLERRGFSRTLSVTLPFAVFSVAVLVLSQLFLPSLLSQFGSLKSDLPRYVGAAQGILTRLQTGLSDFTTPETAFEIAQQIEVRIFSWARDLFEDLPSHVSNSLTVLFLAPFLCFFLLLDGRHFTRQLLSFVPNQFFELALNLQYEISSQMGSFVRARLLESLIVGLLVATGLFLIGFKYALVLALVAAVLNLIPYIGPFIGALPAFLVAVANGVDSSVYLWLTVIYGGAQIVDTVFILPVLVAKIVNLHPVTVVLSVLIGSQVLGVLGMIVSIPFASALKVTGIALYQHLTQFRDGG